MISLDQIYNIYSNTDKKGHPELLGRIVVTPTDMTVLADYGNNFQALNGAVTPKRLKRFAQWCSGSHSFGVSLQDIKEGKRPDLIPEKSMPTPDESKETDDEKWFKVQRDDLDDPMLIKFKEGKAYIADSDSPMDPDELSRILNLTAEGKATIRHHKPVEQMVEMMKSLSKAEPEEEKGPDMSQHLFQDPTTPGLGNRKAFQDQPQHPGVYVMLKGNDLHTISSVHGAKTHEDAHRALGGSLVDALQEHGGQGWRLHGDQFMANLPSHEHAAQFLRSLRGKLEGVTPVGGTHRLSVNAGLGSHPLSAHLALGEAEKAKEMGSHLPGSSPGYAHSLVEGAEGPIAVEPAIPNKP